MGPCEAWDWGITVVVTIICVALFGWYRKDRLELLVKVFVYGILIMYFLDFLYIDFLSPYLTSEALRWLAAIAIIVALILAAYISWKELVFTFIMVLMIARGLPIAATLSLSLLSAMVVWAIFCCGKVADLAEVYIDSFTIAINVAIGLVSMFANVRDGNAPDDCDSKHINMLLVCSSTCKSVVVDDETANRAYWIIVAGAIGFGRFLYIYYLTVYNKPTARTTEDKNCCPCWQKRKYVDIREEALNKIASGNTQGEFSDNKKKKKPAKGPSLQKMEEAKKKSGSDDDGEDDSNKHFSLNDDDDDEESSTHAAKHIDTHEKVKKNPAATSTPSTTSTPATVVVVQPVTPVAAEEKRPAAKKPQIYAELRKAAPEIDKEVERELAELA